MINNREITPYVLSRIKALSAFVYEYRNNDYYMDIMHIRTGPDLDDNQFIDHGIVNEKGYDLKALWIGYCLANGINIEL